MAAESEVLPSSNLSRKLKGQHLRASGGRCARNFQGSEKVTVGVTSGETSPPGESYLRGQFRVASPWLRALVQFRMQRTSWTFPTHRWQAGQEAPIQGWWKGTSNKVSPIIRSPSFGPWELSSSFPLLTSSPQVETGTHCAGEMHSTFQEKMKCVQWYMSITSKNLILDLGIWAPSSPESDRVVGWLELGQRKWNKNRYGAPNTLNSIRYEPGQSPS